MDRAPFEESSTVGRLRLRLDPMFEAADDLPFVTRPGYGGLDDAPLPIAEPVRESDPRVL